MEPPSRYTKAPLPTKPIYRERSLTPAILMDAAESSTRLGKIIPIVLVSGANPSRLFILKNLEALGNFPGKVNIVKFSRLSYFRTQLCN